MIERKRLGFPHCRVNAIERFPPPFQGVPLLGAPFPRAALAGSLALGWFTPALSAPKQSATPPIQPPTDVYILRFQVSTLRLPAIERFPTLFQVASIPGAPFPRAALADSLAPG